MAARKDFKRGCEDVTEIRLNPLTFRQTNSYAAPVTESTPAGKLFLPIGCTQRKEGIAASCPILPKPKACA